MHQIKIIVFAFITLSFAQSTSAQTIESSKWQLRGEIAATHFGDEKFWGNAIFLSTIYDISDQWSGQLSVGMTEGSFSTQLLDLSFPPISPYPYLFTQQHAGQNVDINLLTKLYASDKFKLKVGIGGVYRRWVITNTSGQQVLSFFDDEDIHLINSSLTVRKMNYLDAQILADASYQITQKLGLSLNYTFQGNYITYLKLGINVRL